MLSCHSAACLLFGAFYCVVINFSFVKICIDDRRNNASGHASTSTGSYTVVAGNASVAMGVGITAHEDESLAVSGNIYARNFLFHADERLSSDVHKQGMLDDVGALRVVEYVEMDGTPTATSSLSPRTLGLIA